MSRRHTSARQRELEAQALADWGDGPVADILAVVTPLADDPPPVPCRGSKVETVGPIPPTCPRSVVVVVDGRESRCTNLEDGVKLLAREWAADIARHRAAAAAQQLEASE